MKYFTKNQYNKLIIVDIKQPQKWCEKAYTALTGEQLTFLQDNADATAEEVFQGRVHNKIVETVIEENIENYKAEQIENLSILSLETSRNKVSEYQFLNAQASLFVEDGQGVYSHELAKQTINEYNAIGKLCRDKYYEFVEAVKEMTVKEDVKNLYNETVKWYRAQ